MDRHRALHRSVLTLRIINVAPRILEYDRTGMYVKLLVGRRSSKTIFNIVRAARTVHDRYFLSCVEVTTGQLSSLPLTPLPEFRFITACRATLKIHSSAYSYSMVKMHLVCFETGTELALSDARGAQLHTFGIVKKDCRFTQERFKTANHLKVLSIPNNFFGILR